VSGSLVTTSVSTFTFVEDDGSETKLFPERESGRIQTIAAFLREEIQPGSPIGLLYRSEPNLVLKAPLISVQRYMEKENLTDGAEFTKRLEPTGLTFERR
jgi:hypothetical protein